MSVLLDQRHSSLNADDGRLAVTGEVGFEVASAMAEAGGDWLVAQPSGSDVVFDLIGVDRVSSAALSVLLEWTRRAREAGLRVERVCLSPALDSLTRVAGLDTLLPLKAPEGE
ncbi:STAS domain-containing protein [Halomonas aquatica]|uniref:STAS domain-containing protein n=1 Tax=Halomonas aquatica TaxID=3151123 RepID=A0ABV1NH19_9GAMM